jgi:hypothetical protein
VRRRGVLLGLAILIATAGHVSAATNLFGGTDPSLLIMSQINQARAERGLVPLRSDSRLWDLAVTRSTRLAAVGILSHEAGGSLPDDLAAAGITWYGYGEGIGYASGTPDVAALTIFRLWVASPDHWSMMMSPDYNYLGVGLTYRPSAGVTYASVVLTESPDGTGARAVVVGAALAGNTIRWSWQGWDLPLQTHTAGLRDFTVQLRMDRGPWVTIASATAATARSTPNRVHGHWYGLRVRARDRAGNLGPWSRERRVWLA